MISSSWTHFAWVIAAIHVYVFYLESIAWLSLRTRRLFRMDEAQAEACRGLAFNQGFYNLFLALAIAVGESMGHRILVDYAVASVGAAGIVLLITNRRLLRPASVQIAPALIYLALRLGSEFSPQLR